MRSVGRRGRNGGGLSGLSRLSFPARQVSDTGQDLRSAAPYAQTVLHVPALWPK